MEQFLRQAHVDAPLLVSYDLSRGVHMNKFCHNEHSSLLTNKTAQIHLHLLCPSKCLFVKSKYIAGLAHQHQAQEGNFVESRRPSGSKTTDAFFPQVSNLALHRPEIGQCLSLIALHRLDQVTQIGRELFDFLR